MRPFLLALALVLTACGPSERLILVADNLNTPFGVAFDAEGSLYVVEYEGARVLKKTPDGPLEPFAGTGEPGFSGDGGPALQAQLNQPHSIAVLPGKLYIADTGNHRIRVVDLETGAIDTLVGSGEPGRSPDGAEGKAALLNRPFSIDARDGKLYVADLGNRRVVMIEARGGLVRTIVGNGEEGAPQDGARAAQSPLIDPRAAGIDRRGNVYILERNSSTLRVVDPQGAIRTLITPEHPEIRLSSPKHIAIDLDGDVIIADDGNHRILEYNPDGGRWSVIAGDGGEGDAYSPEDPLATQLSRPHGVAVHSSGDVFICDSGNGRVFRLVH